MIDTLHLSGGGDRKGGGRAKIISREEAQGRGGLPQAPGTTS